MPALCRALRAKQVALHLFHLHADTLFLMRAFPDTARKTKSRRTDSNR
jgi:hypothetical protein